MVVYNIKQRKDLIQLKKNLKKKADVENLEEMGYQANLEKASKPLTEPLWFSKINLLKKHKKQKRSWKQLKIFQRNNLKSTNNHHYFRRNYL